jgi:hypothetical protein
VLVIEATIGSHQPDPRTSRETVTDVLFGHAEPGVGLPKHALFALAQVANPPLGAQLVLDDPPKPPSSRLELLLTVALGPFEL